MGRPYLINKAGAWGLQTRLMALDQLGRTGTPWAIPHMVEALQHKDDLIREAAKEAMEHIPMERLQTWLDDHGDTLAEKLRYTLNDLVASMDTSLKTGE